MSAIKISSDKKWGHSYHAQGLLSLQSAGLPPKVRLVLRSNKLDNLDSFREVVRTRKDLSPEALEEYKAKFKSFKSDLDPSFSMYFLFNHNTLTYEYISGAFEQIIGYSEEEFKNLKDAYLKFFCEEDLTTYMDHIFPTFKRLRGEHKEDIRKMSHQILGRIRNKNGKIVNTFLEYQILELAPDITPVLSFGKLTEVGFPQAIKGLGVSVYLTTNSGSELLYDEVFPFNPIDISEREKEVLRLIGDGKTAKEIADVLFISVNTVKNHRQNLLKKLNLKSSHELVRYALEQGILK